jgi:alkyl sulfatase BDS1-like metallo-beta-lactamase superfamily hydrolase
MKISKSSLVIVVAAVTVALALSGLALGGCVPPPPLVIATTAAPAQSSGVITPKDATTQTQQANAALLTELPFADQQDFQDAERGLIAPLPELTIKDDTGRIVWTLKGYEFLQQKDAPPSVNPSLWRMAQLNMNNGLYKVIDRVYQVRGFDLSNMTIIEGDSGLILIDPLSAVETARAGLDLYYQEVSQKPVKAVIYTHSHADHYQGVKGVTSQDDVAAGRVVVLAPDGFMEAATSENVFAGTAMSRRIIFQYGPYLKRGVLGQVDDGLGKSTPLGHATLISPTDTISQTGETRTIDGVTMQFQMVSGTEAPSEMTIYFPQFKLLDAAEIACPLLHNVLTLRGAQVRDPKKWATSLNEAIALYGDQVEVLIAQHNWPRWGRDNVLALLADERDLYEFINDQSLNLINKGYTPIEIAEMLKLPASLDQKWYTHSYYGTLSHNAKAVYQRYIGWYDGNPANLHPLTPVDSGKKTVEYMGGSQAVIAKAREDFAKGNYRWVAEVMNKVVFAEPDNAEARNLEADAFEQLGYQAEGLWRNWYLVGAYELRNGVTKTLGGGTASPDVLTAMSIPQNFDYLGVRLNGTKADGKTIVLNWDFTDVREQYALTLRNSALTYRANWQDPQADATITLTRAVWNALTFGQTTIDQALASGAIKVTGNPQKLTELLGLLDTFKPDFPIVTP